MLSIGDCNFHAEISSLCRADCSNADKPGAIPQHNGLTPFGKVGVHFGDTMIESYQLTKFLTLKKRNKFLLFFYQFLVNQVGIISLKKNLFDLDIKGFKIKVDLPPKLGL